MVPRKRAKRLAVAAAALAAGLLALPDQARVESNHQMLGTIWKPAAEARRARVAKAKKRRHQKALASRPRLVMGDLVRPGYPYPPGTSPPQTFPKAVPGMFTYSAIVVRYATDYDVPVVLVDAVIRVESNYRSNARGNAGEIGLMQIKLGTARMMGYSGSTSGLFDPENNIRYGAKYLAKAYRLSVGDTCGTILRYNAGHGATRMNRVSAVVCSKVRRVQAERNEYVARYVRALTNPVLALFVPDTFPH
jgi:soluble lytic murein transglycosylase-like protein